ncbi:MAG: MOSC domain-containing protein [Myxococcota bacterium]
MRITGLWFYPVKGCRGVQAAEVRLSDKGIAGDREFVIVDDKGLFLTQRDVPELARIEALYRGNTLVLASDGRGELIVPLDQPGRQREVQVWSSRGTAADAGDDAALWLGRLLGRPVRLVRAGPQWQRAFSYEGQTGPLAFADGYPLLMISDASLADLNERLPEPVPMARFRPNIAVDGIAAYAEDTLAHAQHGGVVLRGVKKCVRCAVTTTDQMTGKRDERSEPLRTLARFRNDKALRGVTFGMNVSVSEGAGAMLRVGDTFEAVFR